MENRVIGMVLVATQTTGTTLVFGSWEGFFHIIDLLFLDMVFNVVDKAKCVCKDAPVCKPEFDRSGGVLV
jgi:hypothetical protein